MHTSLNLCTSSSSSEVLVQQSSPSSSAKSARTSSVFYSYFLIFVWHFREIWAAFSPRKASLQLYRTTQLPNTSTHPQSLIKWSSEDTETAHNKGFSTSPAQTIGLQVYLLFLSFSSSRRYAFYYICQVCMYVYMYAANTTHSLAPLSV